MVKAVKYIFGLIGALITLAIVGVILLLVLVKPATIKTQISDWVRNNTNRELNIEGEMHWTFFPQIGLRADNVTLSNPNTFDSGNFAKAKNMTISLEITPLLHKEFSISRLSMNQLVLNLVKNKNGHENWRFDHRKVTSNSASEKTVSETKSSDNNRSSFDVKLHKIIFKNSTINFHNKKTGQQFELSDVNLKSSNFKMGKPFTISSKFLLNKTNEIELQGKAKYEADESILSVTDFELSSTHPKDAMSTFTVHTTGNVNFNKETLNFDPIKFEFAKELSGTATLQGTHIFKNVNIVGDIHTNKFNLKQLLNNLGKPVNTADKNALKSVKVDGNLSVSSNKITLKKMKATVDDLHLSGDMSYQFSPAAVVVNLVGDDLDIDHFAMHKGESRLNKAAKKLGRKSNRGDSGNTVIKGSLNFKRVRVGNLRFANAKTQFNYQNHIIKLAPFSANVFQGFTSGTVLINTHGKSPHITLKQSMKNISLEQLLSQLTGSKHVTGRANIRGNISFSTGRGSTLKKSLSGNVSINSNNGIIRGTDIDHAFTKQLGKFGGNNSVEADRGYTPYQKLIAKINFGNGVLSNQSLSVDLEHFHIKGDGKLNMMNRGIDYNLGVKPTRPTEVKTQIGSTDISQYYIPLRIKGTIDNPKVSINFTDVLKLTVKKQAEKLFNGQLKDKVHETIGDVLKKALPF